MPAIILLIVNFIAMKSKNRIFFPSVRAALIALAASAMFACSDDDEGFADLAVDSPSLEIQAGQTGLVRILAGSGEYACTGNDPQIADVQLAEQTISVRGLASGSTSFAVEDTRTGQSVSVDVTVSPVPLALSYTDVAQWFAGEQPEGAGFARWKADMVEGIERTGFYRVGFAEVAAQLEATSLNEKNWIFSVTATESADDATMFEEALTAYLNDDEYTFSVGQYSNEEILAEHGRPQSVSLDELQSVLERADFSKEALRVGFGTDAVAVEISISYGEAALIVRPLSFGDNWMWYAEYFIGRDFDELLTEYYFSVKSAGMIPPIYQLMIFAGADRNDIPFNLVLFAQPGMPVEKIEAAYTLDEAQMKAYWIAMLESPDAETEMGVFEQTIVFYSDSAREPMILRSIAETVEWIRDDDFAGVESVMPIFRVSDERVIIPQVSSDGSGQKNLTVTMAVLAAEGASAVMAQ